MKFGPRKQHKLRSDAGKARGPYAPRHPRYGMRPGEAAVATSLALPAALVEGMRERWPGHSSHCVLLALGRLYGEVPARPPLIPFGSRGAAADPVRVSLRLPRQWRLWADHHKVSLSSVVADALVRRWYLGE